MMWALITRAADILQVIGLLTVLAAAIFATIKGMRLASRVARFFKRG